MTLKSRLNSALQRRGITQATLAAILEVPRSAISNWLKNESIPTNHLVKIAYELNISIDWLITGEGPEKLFGPQYINIAEKIFIESLRNLGDEFTQIYLQLISKSIETAYGASPYESIGFFHFMEETHMSWGIVGYDGRILNASDGLFDLLKVEKTRTDELIGTNIFIWIAEEYISEMVVQFSHFLEGDESKLQPKLLKCRLVDKDENLTPVMNMYYTYEIHHEDPRKNRIHIIVI